MFPVGSLSLWTNIKNHLIMDYAKTIEKSHEQGQLRSLSKDTGKGHSMKQKVSFADNRPAAQQQRDMMGIIQRTVHISATYKAPIPDAQTAFQALDDDLRQVALPNAQKEFTEKFHKDIVNKPGFISDAETNNPNIYMSWGRFIEDHLNRVVDKKKYWNRQIKLANGNIPDYGKYSKSFGLFADLTSPTLGDGTHITKKLTKLPQVNPQNVCAADITYHDNDMINCISQQIPIPQPIPGFSVPSEYQAPMQPGVMPFMPHQQMPSQSDAYIPPFPYAVDDDGNRVDIDEWRERYSYLF